MQLSEYLHNMIGRFVPLTESGDRFTGKCPFHSEHTGSFTVDPKTNVFHCFGCDAHGHAEDFEQTLKTCQTSRGG